MEVDILFAVAMIFIIFPLSVFCIHGSCFFCEFGKYIYNRGKSEFPQSYLSLSDYLKKIKDSLSKK